MTIESTDYGATVSCDFCDTEIELQVHSIPLAAKIARERGWRTFRDESGDWCQRCPDCLRKWAQEQARNEA
jgi:hypothetical protein